MLIMRSATVVGMMPWPRFAKILSATILEADPALAAERAEQARTTQDVFSFDSDDGLKTIVAKAAAGDAIWFLATINRIAEILAVEATPTRSGPDAPAPSESWPNRLRRCGYSSNTNTTPPTSQLNPTSPPSPRTSRNGDPDATNEDEPAIASPTPRTGRGRAGCEPEVQPDDHQSLSTTVPPGFHAHAARPRVVLHFHLAEAALRTGHALVRPEDGDPITLDQLVEFLGRSGCQVRIQPVLDPTEVAPVDGYEIPARLRAAVRARQIADVFPFGTCLSPNMDLDHTERYVPMDYGGPPGQTRLGNLGPMARPGHRAATHGGWAKHQPEPGYFVHRSPIGYVYLVTNQGTLALGRTDFSAAVWEASDPKSAPVAA